MSTIPVSGQNCNAEQETQLAVNINKLFERWDKPDSPGAAVSVIKDGKVIYKGGFGFSNLEYDIPITPSTVFHVASVSKQFTAMAITLLAREGKLSLEDDIRKYLPEIHDFEKIITIKHLANHTSGLRDQWELLMIGGYGLDDVITQEHLLRMITRQRELNFDPGEEFMYCNTGYTLMAEIVGRVSGIPLTEFTKERIFKPLGMEHTHFHIDTDMIVKNMAYSYVPDEKYGFKKCPLNFSNVGATSLFTTVEDLAKWLFNFESLAVGDEWVMQVMQEEGILNNGSKTGYGLGIGIAEYKGMKTIGHGGVDAGYRSNIAFFPEQRLGVTILSNAANFNPYDISNQIVDLCLPEEIEVYAKKTETVKHEEPAAAVQTPEDQRKEPQFTDNLEEYVGRYLCEELDSINRIKMVDNKLMLEHIRVQGNFLRQKDKDFFVFELNEYISVRFIRNEQNMVSGFKFSGFRVRNEHFSLMS